jgi:predicted ribosome quality control (RQC) complex YloA/Tae2 family protein
MSSDKHSGPLPPSDADAGIFAGRSIARRFISPDALIVLVGRTAADNDVLSLKLADPKDFWLHVASESGSHVVVRNPDKLERLPRDTLQYAAALAARYSKARNARRVGVHVATCADVHKPRGLPPGKVILKRFKTVHVCPRQAERSPPD